MAAKFPEDSPEISDLMTCAICTEPFEDPKVLPCQHTFCKACLEKYFQSYTNDGSVEEGCYPCPVCRAPVSLPESGLEGLELDPKTSGQLQDLATKIASKKLHCDVCKYSKRDNTAKNHCSHCNINYCDNCSKDHENHNLFQNHAVVPVNQMDKAILRCEVHEAEHVKYYCASCMSPLCTVCAVSEHKGHDTMELNSALGNKKDTIQSKIMGMSEKVIKYEELLLQLEEIQSVREAAVKKTKAEIERHALNMIAKINIRKQELMDELDNTHSTSIKAINLEKENCQFQLANMKSLWKFAAKLMEPSQAVQLIAMHGDLIKMVENSVNAPNPTIAKECIVMSMLLPKESIALGELQKCELSSDLLTRVSEVSDGASFSNKINGAKSPRTSRAQSPLPFAGGRAQSPITMFYDNVPYGVKWHTPKLRWKIDKTGSRKGEINEGYDVTLMPNGDVVVAEWLSQRLQVFDRTGFSKEVIGSNLMQPWGVAVTKEGNLAITDEKERTVKVFSPQGYLVVSWKKMMFGWPRGIVINHAGQYIVTDNQHGRHSVSIHLSDGKTVRQFGSQGSGNEQFHWPRYVTVDHHDRIIVADSSNHCVKVFDPTGQFIFKFGSLGNSDGQMKHPRGVCVDPQDNILVADQDNDRISMYGPDGRFIRHVLNIQRPWGLALAEDGTLAVTQKPALCIFKVFDY